MTARTAPDHRAPSRRAGVGGRPGRALVPVAALVGVAAVAVAGAGGEDGPVLCPWRRCTGGHCPGCGLTRAANQLARGDVAASWALHPLAVLLAVQAAAIAVVVAVLGLARPGLVRPLRDRWLAPLVLAQVGLALAVWLVRLATGAIPLWG